MTGTRHRTVVAVPYNAMAVPKGGRIARPFVFRTDVPVEIEVVRDPPTAVVSCDELVRETAYLGHAGSLWRPVATGPEKNAPPIAAEEALRRMGRGFGFWDVNSSENPFLHIGTDRLHPGAIVTKGAIEEAALRSVVSTDLAWTIAAAQRIAADLLLTEDGRLLRRSVGPLWGQYTADDLHIIPVDFQLPSGPELFACTRLAEAKEFWTQEHPRKSLRLRGTVQINDPGCIPDHDAHIVARSVLRRECAAWLGDVAPCASPSVAGLAERAVRGYERVHGLGIDILSDRNRRNLPTPPSALPPTPEEIVEAVDAMRLFVAEMPGSIGSEEVRDVCDRWRSVYEDLAGRACRRFEQFERPRLPDPEGVPDFGLAPSPVF